MVSYLMECSVPLVMIFVGKKAIVSGKTQSMMAATSTHGTAASCEMSESKATAPVTGNGPDGTYLRTYLSVEESVIFPCV